MFCGVCFCNFRLFSLYTQVLLSASVFAKITTFAVRRPQTYTVIMNVLPRATPAPKTRHTRAFIYGIITAGLFALPATAQLFFFEDMIMSVQRIGFFDEAGTKLFVALIVGLEIWALPYLLRLSVSPLFRVCSMLAGYVAGAIWLGTATLGWSISPLGGIDLPLAAQALSGALLLALCATVQFQFRT